MKCPEYPPLHWADFAVFASDWGFLFSIFTFLKAMRARGLKNKWYLKAYNKILEFPAIYLPMSPCYFLEATAFLSLADSSGVYLYISA